MCWNPTAEMSPEAWGFFAFVVSPNGQAVLANGGHLSLGRTVEPENHPPAADGK
jgi:hypothetical protein